MGFAVYVTAVTMSKLNLLVSVRLNARETEGIHGKFRKKLDETFS